MAAFVVKTQRITPPATDDRGYASGSQTWSGMNAAFTPIPIRRRSELMPGATSPTAVLPVAATCSTMPPRRQPPPKIWSRM